MADQKRSIDFEGFFALQKVDATLRQALLAQLEKDLQLKIESPNPEKIFQQICRHLQALAQKASLEPLLYRVDIPEKLSRQALTSADPFENLSLVLIRREAQKVLFRHQFNS